MRCPGEAVIAAHSEAAAGFENPPRTFSAAVERLLMTVNDALRHAPFLAVMNAGPLELQCGNDGNFALEKQLEAFVIDKTGVLDAIIAGAQGILDSLRCAAMAGHL